MHAITLEAVQFYSAVWAVACLASIFRTIRDGDSGGIRHSVGLSVSSGFLAFGVVAFLVDGAADGSLRPWYWIGVSALVGLLAKEQDRLAKLLLAKVMVAGKTVFDDTKDQEPKP